MRDVRHSLRSQRQNSTHWIGSLAAFVVGVATLVLAPGELLSWPLVIAAVAISGVAAEAGVWLRPRRAARERLLYNAWIAPSLLIVVGVLVLRLQTLLSPTLQLPAIAIVALVLAFVLLMQEQQASRGQGTILGGKFVLSLIVYAIAFMLFVVIYELKQSALVAGLGGGFVGGLLALVLLRVHGPAPSAARLDAARIALSLAIARAGLSFWSAPVLVAGAVLLLVFYVLVGIGEALLDDVLDRRVMLEYGIVAAIGMALVLSTAPWRA